jgi:hypothetical protein
MRPKGVVVYRTPTNPIVVEAGKRQRKEKEELRIAAIERKESRVLLNKHTYAWLYEEWKAEVAAGGSRKLPHCKRCDARLDWDEPAHVCPGFVPKYAEIDWEMREANRRELRESRLEEMRESRNSHYCDDCGEELHDEEQAIAHAEDCPAREEWDGDYERDSVESEE